MPLFVDLVLAQCSDNARALCKHGTLYNITYAGVTVGRAVSVVCHDIPQVSCGLSSDVHGTLVGAALATVAKGRGVLVNFLSVWAYVRRLGGSAPPTVAIAPVAYTFAL